MKKTFKGLISFKRAASLLICILIFAFSVVTAFPVYADGEPSSVTPVISFGTAEAFADENDMVTFKVVSDIAPTENVKVYFHTENRSAVAGSDYTALASSVVIRAGETETSITVRTSGSTAYAAYLSTDAATVYTRTFALVLDHADGAEISPDNNTAFGKMRYRGAYSVTQNGSFACFTEYSNISYGYVDSKTLDGGSNFYTWNYGVSVNRPTWATDYIGTGLASAYSSMLFKSYKWTTAYSSRNQQIYLGGAEFVSSKGSRASLMHLDVDPCTGLYPGEKFDAKANEFISNGNNPYDKDDDYIDVDDWEISSSRKKLYFTQTQKTWFAEKGKVAYSVFYENKPYNGVLDVGAKFYNSALESDFKVKELYLLTMLVDDKTPTLNETFLDDSSLASTGKMRLILRFSEPVYVDPADTTVYVRFNGNNMKKGFEYAGGNFTDTLYFEWKADKGFFGSFTYSFESSTVNRICDLALHTDSYGNKTNNYLDSFESEQIEISDVIDYRNPELSFTVKTPGWGRYHEVDVSTGPVTNGTLYYIWDDSSDVYTDTAKFGSNMVNFITNNTTLSNSGVNGGYYLHVMAVSDYGLVACDTLKNRLYFDNSKPFAEVSAQRNELQTKYISVDFYDTVGAVSEEGIPLEGGSGIKAVKMTLKAQADGEKIGTYLLYDSVTGEKDKLFYLRLSDGKYYGVYRSSLVGLDEEGNRTTEEDKIYIPADSRILSAMGEEDRKDFLISFTVTDVCGNTLTSPEVRYTFDRRSGFESSYSVGGLTKTEGLENVSLYDIGDSESVSFSLSTAQTNGRLRLEITKKNGGTGSITFLGQMLTSSVVDASEQSPGSIELEGLTPGYYEIVPYFIPDSEGGEEILVSETATFYVTSGAREDTANYLGANADDLVLGNKLYRLEDAKFYYLGKEIEADTYSTHLYGAVYDGESEKYTGGSSSPVFSSLTDLRDYVTYMEYQDMYLIKITGSIANSLNSSLSISSYVKAEGEKTAKAGELWIRYKKASWKPGSNAYSWVFYHYNGTELSEGIDISCISSNLRNAVYAVRDTICAPASEFYVVGEENVSSVTGAPAVRAEQIHSSREECAATVSGTPLTGASFRGDSGLYVNTVTDGEGDEFPLAANLVLSVGKYTQLYYKYGKETEPDEKWSVMPAKDGQLLSDALGKTGIYSIFEIDENGAREFRVFVDKTAPQLEAEINGEKQTIGEDLLRYSGKTFSLLSLTNEIDKGAYVAVYYLSTGALKEVYFADEINGQTLSGNNYYVEIGDRSGNVFAFTLRLATSGLHPKAERTAFGVLVTVPDREESEIYSYEVYCNNVLIASEFSERKLYTTAGVYSVVIRDIYGDTWQSETINYLRALPEVSWAYLNQYGYYSAYNPDNPVMMTVTDDETIPGKKYVCTSSSLRFTLGEEYGLCRFEFLDLSPDGYSVDQSGRIVTLREPSGWTLKVWYEEYPEQYVTYTCIVDDIAPSIEVNYVGIPYSFDEQSVLSVGLSTVPETLVYSAGKETVLSVSDGQIICGSCITVSASDNFGVRSVSVSLNGKTVSPGSDGSYRLNGYGSYSVTATDIFGNVGTMKFVNSKDANAMFSSDGKTPVGGSLSETSYGNSFFRVDLLRDGEAEMTVEDGFGKKYYSFLLKNGEIYQGEYAVSENGEDRELIKLYGAYPAVSVSDLNFFYGQWFSVVETEGYVISCMIPEDGTASVRVTNVASSQTVEARVNAGKNVRPDYRRASLSKEIPVIPVYSGEKRIELPSGGAIGYVSLPLSFGDNVGEDVTEIKVAYSETLKFGDFVTVYTRGSEEILPFDNEKTGFYRIIVTNVYGTQGEYTFGYSENARIIVTAEYSDGYVNEYPTAYLNRVIYSNSSVLIAVYGDNISFEVNGEPVAGIVSKDVSRLALYEKGGYSVKVTDPSGTVTVINAIISSDKEFVFDEGWLTGYNEEALGRDKGYTNRKLSVLGNNPDVYMISIVRGEDTEVIYDRLSEREVTGKDIFRNAVGNLGDGAYTVVFRNKYGDTAEKTVYYRETPTLILKRSTAYNGACERYGIDKALAYGFYSSNSITFETVSGQYVFRVNGERVSLSSPKTYEFISSSGNGSIGYEIEYKDEYGFSYSFTACLMRQDIEVSLEELDLKRVGNSVYTSKKGGITFDERFFAYVSVNGGEEVPYASGTPLSKDGSYRFVFTDIAGNVSVLEFIRDSAVRYLFSDSLSDRPLINGGVMNGKNVVFTPLEGDSAFYRKVFLDGEEKQYFESASISEAGFWEFIIADEVGNESYFCFTLITHELAEFEYEAPYGYVISEVWRTDNAGNRVLTALGGDSILLDENGDYAVIMLSEWDNLAVNFTVTIDNTPPSVTLSGCEEGSETARNVTLSGISAGDTVYVYRDGELERTVVIEAAGDIPSFSRGGKYEIIVENVAGARTILTFQKKYIANTAGSILVIFGCFAIATGIFIGLIYRNRSKVDE